MVNNRFIYLLLFLGIVSLSGCFYPPPTIYRHSQPYPYPPQQSNTVTSKPTTSYTTPRNQRDTERKWDNRDYSKRTDRNANTYHKDRYDSEDEDYDDDENSRSCPSKERHKREFRTSPYDNSRPSRSYQEEPENDNYAPGLEGLIPANPYNGSSYSGTYPSTPAAVYNSMWEIERQRQLTEEAQWRVREAEQRARKAEWERERLLREQERQRAEEQARQHTSPPDDNSSRVCSDANPCRQVNRRL